MYTIRHSAILMDLKWLVNNIEETLDMIDHYGIECYLDTCKTCDEQAQEYIDNLLSDPLEVEDLKQFYGYKITNQQLIKKIRKDVFLLPSFDYNNSDFDELKQLFKVIYCDNPYFFHELKNANIVDVHNTLMEKFNTDEQNCSID